MRVFISQPMVDLSKEQIIKNREDVVAYFSQKGHKVINSIFDYEDIENVNNKPLYYLSKSIELISKEADLVYFMDGWNRARGCIMENMACAVYNVPVSYGVDLSE